MAKVEIVKNLGKGFASVLVDSSIHVEELDGVYRPSEDSYLLLRSIQLGGASSFLEVGTGTGLIALHAARHVRTVATDINPQAVSLCKANALRNGIRVEVIRADLLMGLRTEFDLIAFNPPYLPVKEGQGWVDRAWSGGRNGNEVILRFLNQARHRLSPEGRIYLLLSSHNGRALEKARQLYDVRSLTRQSLFFEDITVYELKSSMPAQKL